MLILKVQLKAGSMLCKNICTIIHSKLMEVTSGEGILRTLLEDLIVAPYSLSAIARGKEGGGKIA